MEVSLEKIIAWVTGGLAILATAGGATIRRLFNINQELHREVKELAMAQIQANKSLQNLVEQQIKEIKGQHEKLDAIHQGQTRMAEMLAHRPDTRGDYIDRGEANKRTVQRRPGESP